MEVGTKLVLLTIGLVLVVMTFTCYLIYIIWDFKDWKSTNSYANDWLEAWHYGTSYRCYISMIFCCIPWGISDSIAKIKVNNFYYPNFSDYYGWHGPHFTTYIWEIILFIAFILLLYSKGIDGKKSTRNLKINFISEVILMLIQITNIFVAVLLAVVPELFIEII